MDAADLYRGPLDGFVARRTALVKQLRDSDAAGAAAAAKLRKPPVSVWAIDQLAAEMPGLLTELLAAAADAREAQRDALGGSADGETLVAAAAHVRDLVEKAVRAAGGVLERAGHGAGEDSVRRIRTTLQAAITGTPGERQALWGGTLDRELEPAGFGIAEGVEDDLPDVAAAIAPLRHLVTPQRTRSKREPAGRQTDPATRRAAEREAADREKSADRARAIATTRRQNADRLGVEARRAAAEAAEAETAADAAEEIARTARAALKRAGPR